MAAEKWDVEKGAGACASCGREFVPGDVRRSGLYAEEGALVRRDYCDGCWGERTPAEFSSWQTVVPEPEEVEDKRRSRAKLIGADTLFDILRDTPDSTDPQKTRFRFIIALMLMRRRKLKLVSIARRKAPDGSGMRDALVLKRTGRGQKQAFEIADVKMSEEEMGSAQDEVGALLGLGGGPGPGGGEEEPDSAGGDVEGAAEGQADRS